MPAWRRYLLLLTFVLGGLAFVAVFYGVIPLGQPDDGLKSKLVWILAINPIVYAFLSVGHVFFLFLAVSSFPFL